jgi:hypothetical protein
VTLSHSLTLFSSLLSPLSSSSSSVPDHFYTFAPPRFSFFVSAHKASKRAMYHHSRWPTSPPPKTNKPSFTPLLCLQGENSKRS